MKKSVKKKVSKKKGIDNKNLILGMVVILLLVGVFLYFNNQKDVGLSSGDYDSEDIEIILEIEKGWNLIPTLTAKFEKQNSEIKFSDFKYGYVYHLDKKVYELFMRDGELIFKNEFPEEYFAEDIRQLKQFIRSSMWVYSEEKGDFVLELKKEIETAYEFSKLSDYELDSGWNFLFITPHIASLMSNQKKFSGTCEIEKSYFFAADSQNWVSVSVEDIIDEIDGPQDPDYIGLGWLINVPSDCNFESPEEMVGPPPLPGENEIASAKYNVETMNKRVEAEINKLFVEDQKVVLYLPNRVAEIKQGKKFGMAFGIQNVVKEQKFRWEIKVNDQDISRKCGVREQEAERWVTTGRVGRAEIASGQKHSNFATFNIPEGSVSDISTCIIRYELVIREEDGGIYQVEVFDVDIS